jgi:uncharacterized membrane protein YGL010W
MDQALRNALKQELKAIKLKTKTNIDRTKFLFTATIGWLLMVVATPYLAMNVPAQAPTLFTSLFVFLIFLLGTVFTQVGIDGFEKVSKEKTAGELLDGLELGTKEEYVNMLKATGRSH